MQVLMALSDKYGGVVPINLKNQRIVLLSEPAHGFFWSMVILTGSSALVFWFLKQSGILDR